MYKRAALSVMKGRQRRRRLRWW